jgi:hypothetical protein
MNEHSSPETPADRILREMKVNPEELAKASEAAERVRREKMAAARLEQIRSGVIPARGRGSNGGETPLPEGISWRPHHGRRQRERHLNQVWSRFEKLCRHDEWAAAARERVLDLAAEAPDSELAVKVFVSIGLSSAEKTGHSWATALNHVVNELEAARDKAEADKAAAAPA